MSEGRRPTVPLVVLLSLLLGLVALPGTAARAELAPPPEPLLDGTPPEGWPQLPELPVPIALLIDAETGQVLGAVDADVRREVASTIKVLTALSAASRVELDEEVEVGDEVTGLEGASVALRPGDRWTVRQLVEAIIVRSGNDAAEALAAHVAGGTEAFVDLMTQDAVALGLEEGPDGVVIVSPSGLDDDNRLSASDLATIARVALAHPDLRPILGAATVTLPSTGTAENRNLLIQSYPGATGVKTGFTERAGNSLVASAARDDRELIAVVLGAGPDPERFTTAAALLDHGFAAFRREVVEVDLSLLLAGGAVPMAVAPTSVTVPSDAEVEVDLAAPLRLPGAPVPLPLLVDGEPLAQVSLAATGPAPEPTTAGAALGRALVDGAYTALRADLVREGSGSAPDPNR